MTFSEDQIMQLTHAARQYQTEAAIAHRRMANHMTFAAVPSLKNVVSMQMRARFYHELAWECLADALGVAKD